MNMNMIICWLASWSAGWLDGWLVGWLAGYVAGRLLGWLAGWSAGWLVGWRAGWLVGWLSLPASQPPSQPAATRMLTHTQACFCTTPKAAISRPKRQRVVATNGTILKRLQVNLIIGMIFILSCRIHSQACTNQLPIGHFAYRLWLVILQEKCLQVLRVS